MHQGARHAKAARLQGCKAARLNSYKEQLGAQPAAVTGFCFCCMRVQLKCTHLAVIPGEAGRGRLRFV